VTDDLAPNLVPYMPNVLETQRARVTIANYFVNAHAVYRRREQSLTRVPSVIGSVRRLPTRRPPYSPNT